MYEVNALHSNRWDAKASKLALAKRKPRSKPALMPPAFTRTYPDDYACLVKIMRFIYSAKPNCPHCGSLKGYYSPPPDKHRFICRGCLGSVSPRAEIPFFKYKKIELQVLFYAVYVLSKDPSMFYNTLARKIKVCKPTASTIARGYLEDRARLERLVFAPVPTDRIIIKPIKGALTGYAEAIQVKDLSNE